MLGFVLNIKLCNGLGWMSLKDEPVPPLPWAGIPPTLPVSQEPCKALQCRNVWIFPQVLCSFLDSIPKAVVCVRSSTSDNPCLFYRIPCFILLPGAASLQLQQRLLRLEKETWH